MTYLHFYSKYTLLLLCFFSVNRVSSQSFSSAILKSSITLTETLKDNESSFLYKGAAGFSLVPFNSKNFTLRADCFSKFSETDKKPVFQSPQYSVNAGLLNGKIQLAAGNLGTGKSISLLKKPVPQIKSSAVKKTFSFNPGISFSPVSLSSAEKPAVFYCSAAIPAKYGSSSFSGFISEDNSAAFSAGTKIKFSRNAFFHLNTTAGVFELQGNTQYLKKNSVSFDSFTALVLGAEASFQSRPVKVTFTSTFHQSPWNMWWYTCTIKSRFKAGSFLLDFDFFTIPSSKDSPRAVPLISADSTVVKTVEQAQINPQYVFVTSSGAIITAGLSLSEIWKLEGNQYPQAVNTLRCNFTVLYEQKDSTVNLNVFSAGNHLYGNPGIQFMPEKYTGFSLSGKKNFSSGIISCSLSAKQVQPLTKNDRVKQTFTQNLSFTSKKILDLMAGVSASQTLKNGLREKGSLTVSLKQTLKTPHSRTTLSAQFKTEF